MSKGEYIDWNEIRTAYNRIKGTNFKTVERFVRSLYKETGSLSKMERDLGISLPTISKKLKSYSIEVKGKGGNNRSGETKKSLFLKIPPEKMRKMTKLEISKECEGASIH